MWSGTFSLPWHAWRTGIISLTAARSPRAVRLSTSLSRLRLREPFSGLSHLAGALLSIVVLVVLCVQSRGNAWKMTSFAVYGSSLIILYLASTLYHSVPGSPSLVERFRRLDQCAIYLLIAGSFTPVCLVTLRGPWGWSIFGVAWGIALGGILTQVVWSRMPCWLHVVLYLVMGLLGALGAYAVGHRLGAAGVGWLIAGGIVYLVGAVVFASERPRLWPGVFGFHDLWHVFVLAGSAAHFMMMLTIVHQPA